MKNPFFLLLAVTVGYALAKATKPLTVEVVGTLKASGADLAAALRTRDYRNPRTN